MRKILPLCLLLAAAAPLHADVMADFGPFPDTEKIVKVNLLPCTLLRSTTTEGQTVEEFGMPGEAENPFLIVEVDNPSPEKYLAVLKMGMDPKEPSYAGTLEGVSWFVDILTADLNGDGKPDYVMPYTVLDTGGREDEQEGGEAVSGGRDVLFAFSGKDRYRFTVFSGVQFDEEGFISLLNDGTVQWVHTQHLAGPKTDKDAMGRAPTYYLHRLFSVREDGLVETEGMDERFPKIVSYFPGSRRKNHRETRLLTDEQKKALIGKNPVKMAEWAVKVTLPPTPTPTVKKRPMRKRPAARKTGAVKPAPKPAPAPSTAPNP